MRGACGICYEYLLEYQAEWRLVGFDGDAPVSVQGYRKYPVEVSCVNRI